MIRRVFCTATAHAILVLASACGSDKVEDDDTIVLTEDSGVVPAVPADTGMEGDKMADAGPAGAACQPEVVPPFPGAACASTTLECLMSATDATAADACLAADPDPDNCSLCLVVNVVSCANNNGCQPAWDRYTCCLDTNCPDGDQACAEAMCTVDLDAFFTCAEGIAVGTCDAMRIACFAAPSAAE